MRSRGTFEHDGVEYRSKFELGLAKQLTDAGIPFDYEVTKLKYYVTTRGQCADCGSKKILTQREYVSDFWLPEQRILIEAKGVFTADNRKKHLALQEEYPELDIRFVFQRDNWLTRKHATKYSDWCEKNGFQYAIGSIPEEWIN